MAAFIASGRVIDFIVAGMVLEGIGLAVWHHRTGRGIAPSVYLANLLSGMCLLLAMRVALGGAWWGWAGAFLLGALVAHLTDLARSWTR